MNNLAYLEREDYGDSGTIDAEDLRPAVVAMTLGELALHRFPPRRPILLRGDATIVREGHIAQVYAERGFGKTWLLQTLALAAACPGISPLGFHTHEASRVLHVDGEMAGEDLQERYALLMDRLGVTPQAPITIIASDWQPDFLPRVDTAQGQAVLEPYVEAADLIILDNRSCLIDPESEKDPSSWQPAQNYLLSLRRRGKAVIVGHHSNRMGGARGHSKSEDVMNTLIKLTRPDDYVQDQGARFLVTFDKSRGVHGAAVAPFLAQLGPEGWTTETPGQGQSTADRLLEYVSLTTAAGEQIKSANAAIAGAKVGRNQGLAAWADLLKTGAITKHPNGGFVAV